MRIEAKVRRTIWFTNVDEEWQKYEIVYFGLYTGDERVLTKIA